MQTNKQIPYTAKNLVALIMVCLLFNFQSCSPEEVILQNESMIKSRDYSFKKIDFLELKKINNLVFIESAKLKKVASNDKNKT